MHLIIQLNPGVTYLFSPLSFSLPFNILAEMPAANSSMSSIDVS
jgi:hypothetical protein